MTYHLIIQDQDGSDGEELFRAVFESPVDTLTLARTVVTAIQSIPEPAKPRRTRSDAGKTRAATT